MNRVFKFANNIFVGNNVQCEGRKKPVFPPGTKSLLATCLTDEVWEQCKDKVDDFGFTFLEAINSGVQNPQSSIGVYAGSASSYTAFAPLFDKIIEKYHGHKPSDKHITGWDVNRIPDEPLDPTGEFINSTRIRIARNSSEYPFGTKITREQRKELEQKAVKAFNTFTGDLAGKYYSLETMSKSEADQLRADHFLFADGDKYLEQAGLCRHWPSGRGIFHNNNKTFLIWLNEEDAFRIISMQKGGNIREVFSRLQRSAEHIQKQVKFAENDHLGAVTTCPTNCGTGLRASVHVKLPKLAKRKELMQYIADQYSVQVRGTGGEHTESVGGVYDISNSRRLGKNETELVRDMYFGVKAMIAEEKKLKN